MKLTNTQELLLWLSNKRAYSVKRALRAKAYGTEQEYVQYHEQSSTLSDLIELIQCGEGPFSD